jgi:hypothetical protein
MDISQIRLETGEVELFSGEGRSPTADIFAFASLRFEIAVDRPVILPIGATAGGSLPAGVPAFVSRMIEEG